MTLFRIWIPFLLGTVCLQAQTPSGDQYPWPMDSEQQTLSQRFQPPPGFKRLPLENDSFGHWLRGLPLLGEDATVMLFDGRQKSNQSAHLAVLDIDVGRRDLQQCADAVMRLRAEYLRSIGQENHISFRFTSGHPAKWSDWKRGMRPNIQGRKVSWSQKAPANGSYSNFRRYLDTVFTYAGSASLVRELQHIDHPDTVLPGDVFIQGGYPGHAVIVVDVAEAPSGERVFMLAQSYMPAQQMHVLRGPNAADSPWYPAKDQGNLITPEWRFDYADLHRFQP